MSETGIELAQRYNLGEPILFNPENFPPGAWGVGTTGRPFRVERWMMQQAASEDPTVAPHVIDAAQCTLFDAWTKPEDLIPDADGTWGLHHDAKTLDAENSLSKTGGKAWRFDPAALPAVGSIGEQEIGLVIPSIDEDPQAEDDAQEDPVFSSPTPVPEPDPEPVPSPRASYVHTGGALSDGPPDTLRGNAMKAYATLYWAGGCLPIDSYCQLLHTSLYSKQNVPHIRSLLPTLVEQIQAKGYDVRLVMPGQRGECIQIGDKEAATAPPVFVSVTDDPWSGVEKILDTMEEDVRNARAVGGDEHSLKITYHRFGYGKATLEVSLPEPGEE
jgi:hypothetical protein